MPVLNGIHVTKSQRKKLVKVGVDNVVGNAIKKALKPRKRRAVKAVAGQKGSAAKAANVPSKRGFFGKKGN